MSSWLLVLVLIWPLFWLLRLFLVTRLLLGIEFTRSRVAPVSAEQISPHVGEAAQSLARQLEALGFQCLGGWITQKLGDRVHDEESVVFNHPQYPVRAIIRPYGESSRSGDCWVQFRTTTAAGHEIVTLPYQPEQLTPAPGAIEVELLPDAAPTELLQRHLERIAAVAADAWVCVDLTGAVEREEYICEAEYATVCASGDLTRQSDGSLSYRLIPAIKRSIAVIQRAVKLKKTRRGQPPATPAPISPAALNTFDLQHYRQGAAIRRGRMSLRNKSVITVVSFLLFAGVMAWRTSPVVAITLIVALVFHEFGHLVGMWLFGYRDTQLLFIPFFGGAAVGHDDRVIPPWQHVVIILLGPMPGIFVGLILMAYNAGAGDVVWIREMAITLMALNVFNLIPILPLDGGQILDYAVASRFPRARVIFLGLSAAGLLLIGFAFTTARLIAVLGVAMLLRLPAEWRLAKIRVRVRAEYPDGADEESIVRRLLQELRAPQWKKTSMSHRLQLAQMLQNVLRTPRPGLGTICFALVSFTAPLWMGVPIALWAAVRSTDAMARRAEARAVAAGLESTAPTPPSAAVADEDNAAVPYAQAEALANADLKHRRPGPFSLEVVRLLRTAAHKPVFVPRPGTATLGVDGLRFRWWAGGRLIGQLISAAEQQRDDGQPSEALALSLDALQLIRLVDSAPGWWSWSEHESAVAAAWSATEAALAAGATMTPGQATQLLQLLSEDREIAFAKTTIPRELVQRARVVGNLTVPKNGPAWVRMLVRLENLSPEIGRERARSFDEAIAVRDDLNAIERGEWPKLPADSPSFSGTLAMIARLGDLLAREREARAALVWLSGRSSKATLTSLDTLGSDAAVLQHPFTREPFRLDRHGSVQVLTVSSGVSRLVGRVDADDELVWRLRSDAKPTE